MISTSNKKKVRWIKHYNSAQKILLVGEGDFSFSACLAKAFGSGRNMVATSLQSELFNFPHAGHFYGYCEKDEELIEMHKELLRGFFKNAREMLVKEGGEVHVTHRDDYPYNTWELEKLGAESGFSLEVKVRFEKGDYPGYHNKRGGDTDCNKTFPLGFECFTSKFSLHTENTGDQPQKNKEQDREITHECASGDVGLGGIIHMDNADDQHQKINEHDHEINECAGGDMGLGGKIDMENTGDHQLQKNNEHGNEINECAIGDVGLGCKVDMEDTGDQLQKNNGHDHKIDEYCAAGHIGLGGIIASVGIYMFAVIMLIPRICGKWSS
ncbi:hypothetical protein RHGRI_018112 [Rhododendron griersonianum]|uniref:25S rRNA (uridine-N(3))-methyltransferase BMT5-like domain-containing protein n=1 Tax=Rhododendron griersonianum TaxID=479676 RepID=A0AAV6K0A6_9ERIC|nr:hypothetical protein RHGRI_018112 [Rhododendron griersonianum]